MKIAIHLRGGSNLTNVRTTSFAHGAAAAGHEIVELPRSEAAKDADLVVQSGFAKSVALMGAIERGIPYLIMEAPPFRTLCPWQHWSSFGFNGLAGGAYRPKAPDERRTKPELRALKQENKTLIIGQKPTDHSLRGSDHTAWVQAKMAEYPDAEVRHHPIMVPTDVSIEEALEDVGRVVTYTSSSAVDAAVAGCEVIVEGPGCWWDPAKDREQQIHELSWAAFTHDELHSASVAEYILSGYEGAMEHPYEIPRSKVDGQSICQRYYNTVVR